MLTCVCRTLNSSNNMRACASILVAVLSFFCVVDVRYPGIVEHNERLGCEVFSTWTNAQDVPRYHFLHCPDEARVKVISNFMMVKSG